MFESVRVADGVCRVLASGARWLSTGPNGGIVEADTAYNVTVPEGWPEVDLSVYARDRRERAGLGVDDPGPTLLTGVAQRHARVARLDGVTAVATAGLSNPAVLSVEAGGPEREGKTEGCDGVGSGRPEPGTVNVIVGTDRALPAGALANLVAVAAETKAATLAAVVDSTEGIVSGTTSDAVVAAADPGGEPARFSGSATAVGRAARACVRDAVVASLGSRYAGEQVPNPGDADDGVRTNATATVSRPD